MWMCPCKLIKAEDANRYVAVDEGISRDRRNGEGKRASMAGGTEKASRRIRGDGR